MIRGKDLPAVILPHQKNRAAADFNRAGTEVSMWTVKPKRLHFLSFRKKDINGLLHDSGVCLFTIHIMENCQAHWIHKQVKRNKAIGPLSHIPTLSQGEGETGNRSGALQSTYWVFLTVSLRKVAGFHFWLPCRYAKFIIQNTSSSLQPWKSTMGLKLFHLLFAAVKKHFCRSSNKSLICLDRFTSINKL